MASDTFGTLGELTVAGTTFGIHRLDWIGGADRLPYSPKVRGQHAAHRPRAGGRRGIRRPAEVGIRRVGVRLAGGWVAHGRLADAVGSTW